MLELRERGKTVFFSTHILGDAELLCERVAIIVKGKLRDVGPLGALLSPKVHRIEVLWQGPEALQEQLRQEFSGEHNSSSEGQVYVAREQADVDRFVRAVLGGDGSITQVTPQRETLEELFVRDAGQRAEEQRS
jgi:ABC-2 type transport system ATP-binding protein